MSVIVCVRVDVRSPTRRSAMGRRRLSSLENHRFVTPMAGTLPIGFRRISICLIKLGE